MIGTRATYTPEYKAAMREEAMIPKNWDAEAADATQDVQDEHAAAEARSALYQAAADAAARKREEREPFNSACDRFEHPLEPLMRALDAMNIGKRTPELQASLNALDAAVRPVGRVPLEGGYVAVQTTPSTALPEGYTQPVNSAPAMRKVLIGVPTLGTVRMEWHNAMQGMVIPCNWSNGATSPIGFLTHDAQNLIVAQFLTGDYNWLLLIEDDVIPPPDLFLKMEVWMDLGDVPIVSGLYHVKGHNPVTQPMIYRGRGNGTYRKFKPGDQVWADGVPTGCLLIHRAIIQLLYDEAETYIINPIGGPVQLKRVFDQPRTAQIDMGTGSYLKTMGTSDLHFCEQVIRKKVLARAGFPDIQQKRYPFLVDTSIACGHIDRLSGVVF